MKRKEIETISQNIEGALAYSEAELLYRLASKCTGRGVIVEVGSFQGKSTIFLGKGSLSASHTKVYAIDPHQGEMHKSVYDYAPTWDQFCFNIEKHGVKDITVLIQNTSEEAARNFTEPIELIFIDGLHDYQSVKQDFLIWFPKVIDGGIMAFHDTCNSHEGSRDVAYQYIYKSTKFKNIGLVNSITFAQKTEQTNSVKEFIKNRIMLFKNKVYEFEAKHPSLPNIFKQKIKNTRKQQDRKTIDAL